MQDSSLTGNQQVYQQALDSIQKEIDDMEAAEIAASQAGKGLADYDLSAATAKVRQARVAAEQMEKQRQEESDQAMIGGEQVEAASVMPVEQEEPVVSKATEGGPTIYFPELAKQVGREAGKGLGSVVRPPAKMNKWIEANVGKEGDIQVGKEYDVTPELIEQSEILQQYQEKYPGIKFDKVVQVEDKSNKTKFVVPKFSEEEMKAHEPKFEDFEKYINKYTLYENALADYYERPVEEFRQRRKERRPYPSR